MSTHKRDRRRSSRSLYVWHRWLGVISALLVLWLSVTGILLNHSTRLGMDRHYIHSPWLLSAYGIQPQSPGLGFLVEGRWLSGVEGRLYLDSKVVARLRGELVGATSCTDLLFAVSPESILLLTLQGDLVDTLGGETVPGEIKGVACVQKQVLVRTSTGIYAGNADLSGFVTYPGHWPEDAPAAQPLPLALAAGIGLQDTGNMISRERVLMDLHSGRLLGPYGPLLMDAAALGFIFLALSGLWLWWRHLQSQRHRRQRHPN